MFDEDCDSERVPDSDIVVDPEELNETLSDGVLESEGEPEDVTVGVSVSVPLSEMESVGDKDVDGD